MKAGRSAVPAWALALVFGLALVPVASAQAADAPAIEGDRARFEAQINGDVAALDTLLAPELTYVHSSGVLDSKESFIGAIRSGKTKYKSIAPEEVSVRTFGDVSLVNGKATIDVAADGKDIHIVLRYTDVWVKRDGRWQMVSWHSTRINP